MGACPSVRHSAGNPGAFSCRPNPAGGEARSPHPTPHAVGRRWEGTRRSKPACRGNVRNKESAGRPARLQPARHGRPDRRSRTVRRARVRRPDSVPKTRYCRSSCKPGTLWQPPGAWCPRRIRSSPHRPPMIQLYSSQINSGAGVQSIEESIEEEVDAAGLVP
jgi:hypothetical protein